MRTKKSCSMIFSSHSHLLGQINILYSSLPLSKKMLYIWGYKLIDLRVPASLHWLLKMKLLPTSVCSTHYWKSKVYSRLQIMRKTDWSLFLRILLWGQKKTMQLAKKYYVLWGQKKIGLKRNGKNANNGGSPHWFEFPFLIYMFLTHIFYFKPFFQSCWKSQSSTWERNTYKR